MVGVAAKTELWDFTIGHMHRTNARAASSDGAAVVGVGPEVGGGGEGGDRHGLGR